MKIILIFVSILTLSGCAAGNWYTAENLSATTQLRVVALATSNTEISVIPKPSCDPESKRVLGWFHPDAGSMQASRRGFDRRIGLPLGNAYPENMYAEHIIEATKPINIYVAGVYWVGPTVYSYRECKKVATFTPLPNHIYEVLYSGKGAECNLNLFEIDSQDGKKPKRVEAKFESEPLSCKK
jgi:hypothetical protein